MMPTSLSSLLRMFRPSAPPPAPGPTSAPSAEPPPSGSCGELVSTDGRVLPLRGVSLRAEARGGIARVVLLQRFANPYQEPLRVTYLMALPADAAVSGYAFSLAGKRIVGEVDKKRRARERFETAMLEGKTAGIVEQERSSLFTQELGNVPPGEDITAELTLDQRLIWKSEGAWEWRFPTTVGARYVGAAGQVADAARIAVSVAEHGVAARLALALEVRDAVPEGQKPQSPSHALHCTAGGAHLHVGLAPEEGARLDRDVVVRWPVAAATVGAALDVGRPAKADASYGLLTLVPPLPERQQVARRDLILLLDTSGSMGGEPLAQLQRTSLALVDTLRDEDSLEMIEFSSAPRRWKRGATKASASAKAEARRWIEDLSAGGGTEMLSGMIEALAPLSASAQRQVILMTDGYIGGEADVISQVMNKLPHGNCRVHVVGVGSSVNRTLTGGVARAGGGVETIIAPGEDPAALVAGLLARTAAPLVTDLEVTGAVVVAHAPARLPDLYAGSPALVSLQLRPEGGPLELSGKTAAGPWRVRVTVPACAEGEGPQAHAALFAREAVEDLELARTVAPGEHAEIDGTIEALGLRFQISTRLTTWVAISHDATVDPSHPGRHEVMPSELPHGVSAEGLGLRAAAAPTNLSIGMPMQRSMMAPGAVPMSPSMSMPMGAAASVRSAPPSMAAGGASGPSLQGARGVSYSLQDSADDEGAADGFSDVEEIAELEQSSRVRAADAAPAKKERARSEERSQVRRAPAKMAPPPAAAPVRPEPTPEPTPESAPVAARARLRQRLGDQLVFELEVLAALAWQPGTQLQLRLADGRVVTGKVQPATTRAGTYHAGQVVRLVLEVPGGATLTPIAIVAGGLTFPVVV